MWRIFFEHAPVALAIFDRKMCYIEASRRWREDYALGEHPLRGRSHYDIFPEISRRWRTVHRRALRGEVVREEEDRFVRADGSVQWLRWETRPWRDSAGAVGGIVIFTEDITERKQIEEALRESERNERDRLAELTALLDAVPMPVFIAHDPECRHITGNRAADELLRNPRGAEASLGAPRQTRPRHFRVFKDGRELAVEELPAQRAARGERVEAMELTLVFDDETEREVVGYATPVFEADGRPHGAILAMADITARKRAEEALRESEERYRRLIHSLPACVYSCDARGRIVLYNAAAVKLWGQEPDSRARWDGAYRLFSAEGRRMPYSRSPLALTVKGEDAIDSVEIIIMRPNGSRSRVLSFPHPIRDHRGHVVGAVNVQVDITALTETEAALRRSLHQIRTLSQAVEQSPASVLITTPTGEIDYANPKFTEVTGYKLEEVLGKNPRFLKSGHQSPEFYKEMWDTITSGKEWRGEFCNRRKNGELFWEYAVIAPVVGSEKQVRHFVAIKEDITEQHQAIDLLRDREERLRAILNTVGDGVITIDREGIMLGINPAALQMFGYAEGEMLGRNVRMLMPGPFRDEHGEYLANYHRTGERKIIGARRELQAKRKDGTIFPIELAVSEATHLNIFTGVIRDLTERKRLEAEVLQISEDERQRVAADLHDGICQELVSINFAATALERDVQLFNWQLAARVKKLAQTIVEAAGHTREVARGMNPVVAGGDGLMNALRHFTGTIAETYRVRCHFRCPKPVMVKDRVVADQLYRIVQEAVQNAIQHGKAKELNVRLHASRGALCVVVADDGRGMSTSARSANGLGLRAMNYRARLIGGQLSVQPREGGGTEVTCRIPQTEESP